ncbi:MAG: BatA domain-containing protein, partial [Candidatus Binatia bacterium]
MGFSYPQGLYSLGFLAVLVWIYLRERRQRALEVPSLLLWRSVREESRRSRFSVDPLFLLQAILLASLALGLAQPYLERRAAGVELRRAILVFDTSASMQTIEGGERRFDHARRKAREVVAALHPAEDVMVIAVEARPRVVVAFTRDRMAVG